MFLTWKKTSQNPPLKINNKSPSKMLCAFSCLWVTDSHPLSIAAPLKHQTLVPLLHIVSHFTHIIQEHRCQFLRSILYFCLSVLVYLYLLDIFIIHTCKLKSLVLSVSSPEIVAGPPSPPPLLKLLVGFTSFQTLQPASLY